MMKQSFVWGLYFGNLCYIGNLKLLVLCYVGNLNRHYYALKTHNSTGFLGNINLHVL